MVNCLPGAKIVDITCCLDRLEEDVSSLVARFTDDTKLFRKG